MEKIQKLFYHKYFFTYLIWYTIRLLITSLMQTDWNTIMCSYLFHKPDQFFYWDYFCWLFNTKPILFSIDNESIHYCHRPAVFCVFLTHYQFTYFHWFYNIICHYSLIITTIKNISKFMLSNRKLFENWRTRMTRVILWYN